MQYAWIHYKVNKSNFKLDYASLTEKKVVAYTCRYPAVIKVRTYQYIRGCKMTALVSLIFLIYTDSLSLDSSKKLSNNSS